MLPVYSGYSAEGPLVRILLSADCVWCVRVCLPVVEAVPWLNSSTSSFTSCHNNQTHSFISTPEASVCMCVWKTAYGWRTVS